MKKVFCRALANLCGRGRGRNNRFSNAKQNVRYYQRFTGHFKNPSGLHAWVHEFKLPQLVYQVKCIMATFDVHKYSFCKSNTYCANKPCIVFFYFFFTPSTAKSLIKHTRWRWGTKGKEIYTHRHT